MVTLVVREAHGAVDPCGVEVAFTAFKRVSAILKKEAHIVTD